MTNHAQREGGTDVGIVAWRGMSAAGVALVAIAALAVSRERVRRSAQTCGTVTINEQSWVGTTANTYVAKYVLEKRLGCKVKITNITEGTPYFQAMRDGKIDVALEDWDNWTENRPSRTSRTSRSGWSGRTGSSASSAGTSRATC